jgi:hypothetical protein
LSFNLERFRFTAEIRIWMQRRSFFSGPEIDRVGSSMGASWASELRTNIVDRPGAD